MRKYQKTFSFCDTKEEAQAFINEYNSYASRWRKKRYPGHITEWKNETEHKWIAWYSI